MRFSRATSTRNVLSEAVPCARDFDGFSGRQGRGIGSSFLGLRSLHLLRRWGGVGGAAVARAGLCDSRLRHCGSGTNGLDRGCLRAGRAPRLIPRPLRFGAGACSLSSRAINAASSPSPSPSQPAASIVFSRFAQAVQQVQQHRDHGAPAVNLPSRSRPSRFSPAWASFSRRLKPRNPVVPLMVCTERKISARSSCILRPLLQFGQAPLHAVQPFLALDQELPCQIVHDSHSSGRPGSHPGRRALKSLIGRSAHNLRKAGNKPPQRTQTARRGPRQGTREQGTRDQRSGNANLPKAFPRGR